jgi:hypothetical protein
MDKEKFDYLFEKNGEDTPAKNTNYAKIATFVLFFIFLFGFLQYAPYDTTNTKPHNASIFSELFWLYFFIVQQTLGIVHEAGHGICYILPCPEFFMVINGTIFQWLFPAGIGLYFYKRGNKLMGLMGLFFLGISMQYTAWYISTAHEGLMVPASKSFLGVDGYHDFNYILSVFHLVKYDWLISNIVKFIAYIAMIGSVFLMFLAIFEKEEA